MADRKTGITTRLADKAIQNLFKNNIVIIKDEPDTIYLNRRLFDIVRNRLDTEHRGTKIFKFDRSNLAITIEKYDKQLR